MNMLKRNSLAVAAAASLFAFAGAATADYKGGHGDDVAKVVAHAKTMAAYNYVDYTKMSSKELAEHITLKTGSYKSGDDQMGGKTTQRLVQDDLQKICTDLRGKPSDGATYAKINEMAKATIKYPEGGIKLGDWKKGRALAWSGFGWRVGHKNDDHSKKETGANCYNCHQLATDRTGGSIGPELTGYGKTRGNSEAMIKYAYEVIYNPHSYFACTYMPRMGANGVLSQEQISHILAYLFDPESPVNQ
jgi:sulfur-oxidizing protein SoxX